MSTPPARPARGVGALGAQSFDALAALGGWRGVTESVAPTLVFVLVLAARPSALLAALGASLALSALALAARLLRHEPPTQAVGGAALAALSAAWAWHSGSATDFYATGLLVNAAWLAGSLASLALGWPVVGLALNGVQALAGATGAGGQDAAQAPRDAPVPDAPAPWAWRTDPDLRHLNRRYRLGTWILAAMFATRLAVETPLYLAGATGPLGAARLALGVPLFALTLWLIWLLVGPAHHAAPDTTAP
ncbi:DUF3159 domain-containing protein [uncultured Actinomyces sp.]|uniref:DUF3159 domain-containing protein n=1 Tax=uncultured Actinomyces sp. TaxID=249061 RepID=UPI002603F16C|nr:DUF3159 domain-containing protein [uncultured Actinomyces sp.]